MNLDAFCESLYISKFLSSALADDDLVDPHLTDVIDWGDPHGACSSLPISADVLRCPLMFVIVRQ